jgi:cytochrome c553
MIALARVLAAAAATLAAGLAVAQQPPPPVFAPSNLSPAGVRSLAANCAACHGTNGRPAQGSTLAGLAGKPRNELLMAMTQFKEGKKPATLMHQLGKGYTDAELEALADYFSKQGR